MMLGVVLVVVAAVTVVGPGRVIEWLGNYLIPVVVVLGVIIGVFGLAAWEIARLHDKHKQPW
jgi:branched-subunit amino acid permease